jgi:hypothetical protein
LIFEKIYGINNLIIKEKIKVGESPMPQNGYWIECIPVSKGQMNALGNEKAIEAVSCLYEAKIGSIPEAMATSDTPDSAIQKLRDKLAALRHDYCMQGKELPEPDSPIRPPRHSTSHTGWISVYIKMNDCCRNS